MLPKLLRRNTVTQFYFSVAEMTDPQKLQATAVFLSIQAKCRRRKSCVPVLQQISPCNWSKSGIQKEGSVLSFRRADTNLMFTDDSVERENVLTIKITATMLEMLCHINTFRLLSTESRKTQLQETKWTNCFNMPLLTNSCVLCEGKCSKVEFPASSLIALLDSF